jgi:hypothetical protein
MLPCRRGLADPPGLKPAQDGGVMFYCAPDVVHQNPGPYNDKGVSLLPFLAIASCQHRFV